MKLVMQESQVVDRLSEVQRLEIAADQAIAACGGDAREAVKVLLVANESLEAQVAEGYLRGVRQGRFNTYSG